MRGVKAYSRRRPAALRPCDPRRACGDIQQDDASSRRNFAKWSYSHTFLLQQTRLMNPASISNMEALMVVEGPFSGRDCCRTTTLPKACTRHPFMLFHVLLESIFHSIPFAVALNWTEKRGFHLAGQLLGSTR